MQPEKNTYFPSLPAKHLARTMLKGKEEEEFHKPISWVSTKIIMEVSLRDSELIFNTEVPKKTYGKLKPGP